MASYNKYPAAIGPLLKAGNLSSDTWKIALASTVNSADTSFTAGTSDLATSGGYTAGGNACSVTSANVTAGVLNMILGNPATWTASGGGFSFRYAILWNVTLGIPVGYWDYGSTVTMNGTNADTFAITLDGTNGVFSGS